MVASGSHQEVTLFRRHVETFLGFYRGNIFFAKRRHVGTFCKKGSTVKKGVAVEVGNCYVATFCGNGATWKPLGMPTCGGPVETFWPQPARRAPVETFPGVSTSRRREKVSTGTRHERFPRRVVCPTAKPFPPRLAGETFFTVETFSRNVGTWKRFR